MARIDNTRAFMINRQKASKFFLFIAIQGVKYLDLLKKERDCKSFFGIFKLAIDQN